MKINGSDGIGPIKAYISQMKKDKVEPKAQEIPKDGRILEDSVEISKEAMSIKTYKGVLDKLPAIREELVNALKQSVEDGTYRPDNEKIALGIIAERHLDKGRL